MYDAIVIGAHCAGSPTAMLLGRLGYRVLLVDKAMFPSDAMSTHFICKPYGTGWALVGDVGYHKDPYAEQGITDAFRDVELVVEAIDAGCSGRRSLEEALAGYEQRCNATALPLYEYNAQAASLKPRPPEMQQLLVALQENQEHTVCPPKTTRRSSTDEDFLPWVNIQRKDRQQKANYEYTTI